ncbi:MAG: polysaccharide deacetylase family protein [Bacteriovorax sp.]|nr:polysaccharide deacetylase family protein [Bacteriovorax sp.]
MKHILIITFVLLIATNADAREVALSFDDCPRKLGPILKPLDRDQKLVAGLKEHGITAVFFCNSPSREVNGFERLKLFAANGHLIANHSASHPDLNKLTTDDFAKNIDQADSELQSLPNFRKWFRFPFLHEGKYPKDVETIRTHLKKIGYSNGYVTIDTEDWYVDEVLRQKVTAGKKYDEKLLCRTYARMMADDGDFFDKISVEALGRSVKHVILLHETDLNAICLSFLIKEYKNRGWTFISPDVAYKDPIASFEPLSSTKLNEGRVFALAKEKGYAGPEQKTWGKEIEIEQELEKLHVWR